MCHLKTLVLESYLNSNDLIFSTNSNINPHRRLPLTLLYSATAPSRSLQNAKIKWLMVPVNDLSSN